MISGHLPYRAEKCPQIRESSLRGIKYSARLAFMSPGQAALRRQALVMAMAFPHHPVQEKTASEAGAEIAPREMCTN
jgi:hypothetical protein